MIRTYERCGRRRCYSETESATLSTLSLQWLSIRYYITGKAFKKDHACAICMPVLNPHQWTVAVIFCQQWYHGEGQSSKLLHWIQGCTYTHARYAPHKQRYDLDLESPFLITFPGQKPLGPSTPLWETRCLSWTNSWGQAGCSSQEHWLCHTTWCVRPAAGFQLELSELSKEQLLVLSMHPQLGPGPHSQLVAGGELRVWQQMGVGLGRLQYGGSTKGRSVC